jgi:hypothetical protein
LLVAGSWVVRVDDHNLIVSAIKIHVGFGLGLARRSVVKGFCGGLPV